MYTATPIGNEKYKLGEGPYYDSKLKRLSWVDITDNKIWYMGPDCVKKSINLPQHVGSAIPLKGSEGFACCMEDGIYKWENEKLTLAVDLKNVFKPHWRSNDAKADARGRIWCGASVNDDDLPAEGNLYLVNEGNVSVAVAGTKISNGMAWSSDRKKFYFSDSLEHAVFVFDYEEESGMLSNRKVLFEVENGVPDGLCIDSDDNIWLAVWGGSRVEKRCGKTGKLLDTVNVPAEHTSSCCFGGDDMTTLYITSSGDGLTGKFDGCIFKCEVEAKGVPYDGAVL